MNVSSNSSLSHLAMNCAALTSMMASQCYRLEQLQEGFSCPSLEVANLAGCKALQGEYHPVADPLPLVCPSVPLHM